MDWNQILERDDIVGGDFEIQEDGFVYRGPIESADVHDGKVCFEFAWMARKLQSMDGGWENYDKLSFSINTTYIRPNDIGDGRIAFSIAGMSTGVIFPKGGSRLDPAKVRNLKVP